MTTHLHPRSDLDAPGGLAFFEWAYHEKGKRLTPRIADAVTRLLAADDAGAVGSLGMRRRPALGAWAENDWDTTLDAFRRAGLHINNPTTRDEIRDAVGEWLAYRATLDLVPDGFEVLEDYYLRPAR